MEFRGFPALHVCVWRQKGFESAIQGSPHTTGTFGLAIWPTTVLGLRV